MIVEMMVMVMDDGRDECDGGDAAVMIVLMNDGGHCTLVIWKIPSPHSSLHQKPEVMNLAQTRVIHEENFFSMRISLCIKVVSK